jgi:hypothetical protein
MDGWVGNKFLSIHQYTVAPISRHTFYKMSMHMIITSIYAIDIHIFIYLKEDYRKVYLQTRYCGRIRGFHGHMFA